MRRRRLLLFTVLAFLFLFGSAVLFMLPQVLEESPTAGWEATTGLVTATEVRASVDPETADTDYVVIISYSYTVGGEGYTGSGTSLQAFGTSFSSREAAERYAADLLGQELTVYYDPSNPSDSVLSRWDWGGFWSFVLWGALVIFVASGLMVWFVMGRLEKLEKS